MPEEIQSIEDLIDSSQTQEGDKETAQTKLSEKQSQIKIKEIERLTKNKAADLGLPYINLTGFPVSPEALLLIEEEEAKKLKAVCFFYNGSDIRLGATSLEDKKAQAKLEELMKQHYCKGQIYLISEKSFDFVLGLYKKLPKVVRVSRGVEIKQKDLDKYTEKFSSFKDLQKQIQREEVTETVTVVLAAAIRSGSSDIHIEREENDIKVRFRVDGVLHDVADLNKNIWQKIISRLKLLAGVKINITDKPQDGRLSVHMKGDRVDIRASFLPTAYGESVVMRLLRSSSVGLEFEELGIRGRAYQQLKKEIERPNGMIITTGPTGSGKTTTLYAILKKLNKEDTKIITIEDPIEYQLVGVNQSQVSKNYSFAQGLRSIVRQDPDIVMVGEVRDLETAEISIQAALTGHLVLSTIHTNDAAGTVPRLLSMGAKSFLIAPAINAMIGQRLVRKICEHCKTEDKPGQEILDKAKKVINDMTEDEKNKINIDTLKFYKGKGCEKCQHIGYRGRIGIYEVMVMNKQIEALILGGKVSEIDMHNQAKQVGMLNMVQDGLLKALDGITSLEELFRVAE